MQVEFRVIRDLIKECLDKGCTKFVIYPYTEVGILVKNILMEYYEIKPEYIIDNGLCKYNTKIKCFEVLKENYDDKVKVILTTTSKSLNQKLENMLLEFVPQHNIINLYKIMIDKEGEEITNQFALNNILPKHLQKSDNIIVNERKFSCKKIKIRFMYSSPATWNAISTICKSFEKDKRFDMLLLGCTMSESGKQKMEKQLKNVGYKYILADNYDIQVDSPDILVVSHHFADIPNNLMDARKYTKMIVVASMALISYGKDIKKTFWGHKTSGFETFQPDYSLFDKYMYKKVIEENFFSGKVVEMGNAKYDLIYEKSKLKDIPKEWSKLKGKKIVLWSTDHGIVNGKIRYDLTFDVYAKYIFEYAKKNTDVGFIFRPHMSFINEMLNYNYWNKSDIENIKNYMEQSDNMVWDDFDTYDYAYSLSDAMLVDGYCGMIMSALPLMKPICCMFRYNNSVPLDKEIVDNYYQAHNVSELEAFLDNNIKVNYDPMYDKRKCCLSEYVKNFDGKNGERIKDFIEKEFMEHFADV